MANADTERLEEDLNLIPELLSNMEARAFLAIAVLAVAALVVVAAPASLALHNPIESNASGSSPPTTVITYSGITIVWSSVSQFEVAEGLTVVALLLLVLIIFRQTRSDFSRLGSSALGKHLKPRLSYLSTALALVGASVFVLFVLSNTHDPGDAMPAALASIPKCVVRLFGFHGRTGYGMAAFVVWALTLACLSLAKGFIDAMKLFGFPAVLLLTTMVLVFDPYAMDVHAANFASWTFGSTYLFSNWFLFVMSLSFVLVSFVPSIARRARR
jgi:hypothetical protein